MKLKKTVISLLFLLFALGGFFSLEASASVDVGVNINIGPPPIVVAEPPAVVVVPQSRVYFVPEPGIDIFFYSGYWWSPRGDRWYRSLHYNHGWVAVNPAVVPHAVIYVPRDYRVRYAHERHIPYGQWKKNHQHWEKERMESHKRWEKEREKEWRRQAKNNRYDGYGYNQRDNRHGNHSGGIRQHAPGPSRGPGDFKSHPPPRHGGKSGDKRGGPGKH